MTYGVLLYAGSELLSDRRMGNSKFVIYKYDLVSEIQGHWYPVMDTN